MTRSILSAAVWTATVLAALTARATLYDVIVEPDPDGFWDSVPELQILPNGNYDDGPYYYIYDWGSLFGTSAEPARVWYDLPPMPSGEHLYNVYAWNPAANSNQWHAINANADGTDSFPTQQISWVGQFGTNRQWIAYGADTAPGGQWIRLGPGPQMDPTAYGGRAFRMNPFLGPPRFYVTYQPWYSGAISFAAVRVVRAPDLVGDVNFDGKVDIFDVNFVSANWAGGPDGDANGDLLVDIFDVNVISANWGAMSMSGGGGASSVPEPAAIGTAGLAFAGLGIVVLRRRAKRRT